MNCDEARSLLSGLFDDELDRALRVEVQAHLETCAFCSEALDDMRRVGEAIRGAAPAFTAPEHLRDNVRFALRGSQVLERQVQERKKRASRWKSWGALAAGIVIVAALGSAPFLVNARNQQRALGEEIVSAHQRALAGREMDVISTDRHTVKPWFNGKLPFSPPVADHGAEGFPLEGGRLDYISGQPVAALVYRRRLHRIDVFVRPAEGEMPPARFDRYGFHEISWKRGDFAFTCVSDLDAAELTAFAELLKRG
ncbi:MAG TPA: anti-sigma factor [Bryobacteraceae bacterium]|nr:anti-sigma factor [Bryobacteraceae bacterium]